ncbi:MAG: hypothetical protein KBI41_13625 [Kiritimatiellae bacterium]|nr:hypothetical protein [Kiritimatiellia bacterium]
MDILKSKYSWSVAPLIWLVGMAVLFLIWAIATPEWIQMHFDDDGKATVEIVTVGLFFFQIGFFWLVPPMHASRSRPFWLTNFSLISFFAICRQLDWHRLLITPSNLPGATRGTPFKLRFLTNPVNPLADRLIVAACFVVVILVCGGTLLYFLRRLWIGLFKFHPVSWSIGFLGGTLVLNQIVDRLPAILRKDFGIYLSAPARALITAIEEGMELLLPLFVIVAVLQAHFIYNNDRPNDDPLARFKEL